MGIEIRAYIIFIYKAVNFTFIKYNTVKVLYSLDLKLVSLLERFLKESDKVYLVSFDNAEKKVVYTCVKLISYCTFY